MNNRPRLGHVKNIDLARDTSLYEWSTYMRWLTCLPFALLAAGTVLLLLTLLSNAVLDTMLVQPGSLEHRLSVYTSAALRTSLFFLVLTYVVGFVTPRRQFWLATVVAVFAIAILMTDFWLGLLTVDHPIKQLVYCMSAVFGATVALTVIDRRIQRLLRRRGGRLTDRR